MERFKLALIFIAVLFVGKSALAAGEPGSSQIYLSNTIIEQCMRCPSDPNIVCLNGACVRRDRLAVLEQQEGPGVLFTLQATEGGVQVIPARVIEDPCVSTRGERICNRPADLTGQDI